MNVSNWMHRIEDGIYTATGSVLGIAAVVLLLWSVVGFVQTAIGGEVGHAVLQTLDSLLLVLMLAEILHTVRISVRDSILAIEPFLVVGLIAAIRRVLIVTAEQAHPTAERMVEFQMAMLELGILTVMILALVGAIYGVRRASLQQKGRSRFVSSPDSATLTPSDGEQVRAERIETST